MLTHDVTVSSAECGKCNGDIAQWTTREKESWVHMVHFEHLKAQKDAWWLIGQGATRAENPIKAISDGTCELEPLGYALRAQREAKK